MSRSSPPQTDGMRIIFPINSYCGTYDTRSFDPTLVDNRLQTYEIHVLFDEIYRLTNHISPIRKQAITLGCMFTLYLVILAAGLTVELLGFQNNDFDMGWSGLSLVLGSSIVYILVSLCAFYAYKRELPDTYKQIVQTIASHQSKFQMLGLRWAVPQNLRWIELWMDYRLNQGYIPPMFMPNGMGYPQPYLPLSMVQNQMQNYPGTFQGYQNVQGNSFGGGYMQSPLLSPVNGANGLGYNPYIIPGPVGYQQSLQGQQQAGQQQVDYMKNQNASFPKTVTNV